MRRRHELREELPGGDPLCRGECMDPRRVYRQGSSESRIRQGSMEEVEGGGGGTHPGRR